MFAYLRKSALSSSKPSVKRSARPLLENLEDRLLLYSTYGPPPNTWVYGSRITYSFMPDYTSVGGISSVLFQTLDAKFSQATWELQFQKAAAVWQAVANINLSQVSDNGSPEATNGDQQDDPRFGDIRIGMVNLGSGVLGETFLPPPYNGGTAAGDMFLNSTASWQINTDYDLETVAIHEFGHALGLGESQITTACMYAYYNGMKQSLTTDDVAGIQSVWGAPQPDQFNSNGLNDGSFRTPANITSYIGSNGQAAIPSLRITSPTQVEWFSVTVPASTTGTMVVTEQSSNLSMLSPTLWLYKSSSSLPITIGSVSSTAFGATVSYSVAGVQAGQTYLIRTFGNAAGDPTGGFGLEVNFGSATQPPIPPPNTVVLQQPDQGGGVSDTGMQVSTGPRVITIGNLSAQGDVYSMNAPKSPSATTVAVQTLSASATQVGTTDAVTPLVAVATAQPGLPAGKSAVALAAAGQARSSISGSTPSALQAVDAIILGWKFRNRLSVFTKGNTTGSSRAG
jgi:hypothetical protein